MKLLYVNLSFYEYVHLVEIIFLMFFLCWSISQLLEMFSMRCERALYLDMACIDKLNAAEAFAYKFTIELSFTSIPILYTDVFSLLSCFFTVMVFCMLSIARE